MATQTRAQAQTHARTKERAERRLLGQLSRRDLARRTGLHHSYVAYVLAGKRQPRLEVAALMAKVLKLTLDQFRDRLAAVVKLKLNGGRP